MVKVYVKAEVLKSLKEQQEKNKLEYFKKELLKVLEQVEKRENNAISKAIEDYDNSMAKTFIQEFGVEKAGYGIGTVRVWKGKKYRKVAKGKWVRIYDKEERGIITSVENIKKQINEAQNFEELGKIISQNIRRFYDENNKILPIAQQIITLSKAKQKEFNSINIEPKYKEINRQIKADEIKNQYNNVKKLYENSDNWMKAPNGEKTKLTEKQWLQVRTPNFIRWFGNWNYNPQKKIAINKFNPDTAELKGMDRKSIGEWLQNNLVGKNVTILENQQLILFYRDKTRSSIKQRSNYHNESYEILTDLIKNSTYFDFELRDNQDKHKQLIGQDIYYSALEMNGKLYSVRIKIDVNKDTLNQNYKDHQIKEVAVVPQVYALQRPYLSATSNTISIGDLVGFVKPNSSKVVDENGEPMVCYHGTKAEFDTFDKNKINKRLDGVKGFYFSTKKRKGILADGYAEDTGTVLPVFLNLRNPKIRYANSSDTDLSNNDGIISLFDSKSTDRYYDYKENKIKEVEMDKGDIIEIVAFNPNQIKSAENNDGAFNPFDDSINKSCML